MEMVKKIKSEIEKRLALQSLIKGEFAEGSRDALNGLLSFLSALESEKPMELELTDEQLDKEVELWYNEYAGNLRFDWIGFARHFAKWGAEHLVEK